MTEASQKSDGLAVLAYFYGSACRYRYRRNANSTETVFAKHLYKVQEPSSSVTLRNPDDVFSIKDIIHSVAGKFIHYQGSLTTPACK